MSSRNMIFRMGIDASDFVTKMRRAGVIAGSVGAQIQKSLSGEGFVGLRKQIAQMESARDAVLSATEGMDLSRPLSKQIQDAMADREKINAEYAKVSKRLYETRVMPVANTELAVARRSAKIQLLRRDLSSLDAAYASVSDTLAALQGVANDLGPENLKFASTTELKKLDVDIKMAKDSLGEYKKALLDSADAADNAAENAEDLGQAASRTSRSFRDMSSSGSFMERVSDQIGRIRSSADRSDLSVGKLLRSIRNISVADFGFRLVRSVFGELRSITSGYISQNETLQAQVDGLNASMGQALAPAINVVTNAMSYLMPYVVGVSNAFGELMTNLFGSGWTTAAADAQKTSSAISDAADAQKEMNRQLFSFDQINKMSSAGSSAAGGGGSETTATPIEGKTPAWAERFKSTFSELFDSEEFQNANIGGKIGQILQTGLDWLGDEGADFDWRGVGTKLRENLDSFMDSGWGASLFSTAGIYVAGFADAIAGFLEPEFSELSQLYAEKGPVGALEYVNGLITGFPGAIADVVFSDLISPFFSGMEEYFRGKGNDSAADFFAGLSEGSSSLGAHFDENLSTIISNAATQTLYGGSSLLAPIGSDAFGTVGEACADGLYAGLESGMSNAESQTQEIITDPLLYFVKKLLGIHSPSTVFASIGESCMAGMGGGFKTGSDGVLSKLSELVGRVMETSGTLKDAFNFEWKMPSLKLPHLSVSWDPVDNVLAQFFGVTAFPQLSVSWFAKGGILDGAQIFGRTGSTLLGGGEAGREAILPLDSNTSWMDDLADRIALNLSGQNSDVNATINLILDGEVLTTTVIRGLRSRSRSGAPVF